MNPLEKAVRDAAQALHDAIVAATAAGFQVAYPRRAEDLSAIAVSEPKAASATAGTESAKTGRAKKS